MSHPYTRVCFRVGDDDARKLASGFSYFDANDLQNLGTGEAVARIERADFDFNLRTILPPQVEREDAQQQKAYLRYLTRRQYGRPREEVEKELAESRAEPPRERVDPFAKRTAKAKEKPTATPQPESPGAEMPPRAEAAPSPQAGVAEILKEPPAPAAPKLKPAAPARSSAEPTPQGRGGPIHQHVQAEIKGVAEGFGFRASIEGEIPNCDESVDVLLQKGGWSVACEISVTG